MADYKTRQKEFVSGLPGGTVAEIYGISGVLLVSFVTYALLRRNIASSSMASLVDFFFNWGVPLVAVTVYSSKPFYLTLALLVSLALFQSKESAAAHKTSKPQQGSATQTTSLNQLRHKPFITAYRSYMLVLTTIAILAVDFRVFPRRFAKVETWGTSLMDLGVGSFVFSMGVVSARPYLKVQLGLTPKKSLVRSLALAFQYSAKLLALGLCRLAMVKQLGYQEHETEYGTHWNFFVTLGLLPPLVTLLERASSKIPLPLLGLSIAFGYELALKNTGLLEWALTAPRVDLLSHNREGLCSFFGYLAIFMIGESVGFVLLPSDIRDSTPEPAKSSNAKHPTAAEPSIATAQSKYARVRVFGFLVGSSLVYHALFLIFRTETAVSRRLANLPYVLWTCGYNTGLLAAFYAVCSLTGADASPSQVAVNNRGQTMFLLANLLTGAVNLCVNTIDQKPHIAMAILTGYVAVLYLVAMFLAAKQ